MALAANALTDTGVVRDELGLDTTQQDHRIDRLINAVSEEMEELCGRVFGRGTGIVEKQPGYGNPVLVIDRPPLVTITQIKIDDEVLDVADFEIEDAEAGFIRRKDGLLWPWTALRRGDITRDRLPGTEELAIEVTYDGGWILPKDSLPEAATRDLPHDIEGAVIDEVVSRFRQRGRDKTVVSEKALKESVTYGKSADGSGFTPAFMRVAERYMRKRFGR